MELKNPITYKQQLELLKKRGCIITDDEQALLILKNTNYYRLSAYFLPFKESEDKYRNNTTLERVFNIYEFDRKLRRILFSALEEIEVSFRARVAYYHAQKYGAQGYLNPENYNTKHKHQKFIENFQREVVYSQNVPFVAHHIEKYEKKFPIWVATELFTFGMISKFYSDLILQDQKHIARDLYNSIPKYLISCLRCCTDLRNICAHYGRLYFRVFSAMPDIKTLSDKEKRSLWGAILAMKAIYPSDDKWESEIKPSLVHLFSEYKTSISITHIGFPADWINHI